MRVCNGPDILRVFLRQRTAALCHTLTPSGERVSPRVGGWTPVDGSVIMVPIHCRDCCRQMSTGWGLKLILAGTCIGWYSLLPGATTIPSLPQPPAAVIPPPPTAAQPPVIEATVYVVKPKPRAPLGQSASGVAPDPASLGREIQLQLKRLGCYHGDTDGLWSPAVRQSMKAFLDRVNAALPTGKADIVLLEMLRNHQGVACSESCPAGQRRAADGRCLPHALAAGPAKKHARTDTPLPRAAPASRFAKKAHPRGQPYDEHGRMALAGPPPPGLFTGTGRNAPAKARRHERERPRPVSYSGRFPPWAMKAFSAMH